MRRRALTIGLAGLLTLGGVAMWRVASTNPLAQPTPEPTVEVPQEAETVVVLANADLAQRLGIAESQIRVVAVEVVDWPDTSLGYPQPGYAYAQVITPGFRILLEAGGQIYEYHSDYFHVVFVAE